MTMVIEPGQIIVLNGAPRSGKSTIAAAIQEAFDEPWMNIGVDASVGCTPPRYRPGIGLRPGGERPDLEPLIPVLYRAMYESVAAHSRLGVNVVVDVGHHDSYSRPLGILPRVAQLLRGLPALLVGVRCPLDVIMQRRGDSDGPVPEPVLRWQHEVHVPGIYDLEVDTSVLSPAECADAIRRRVENGPPPNAFPRLRSTGAAMLKRVDAVTVRVPDLDAGLAFYRDRLGHRFKWRNDDVGQAGLELPDGDSELVLTTQLAYEPNWLVDSVDAAVDAFRRNGGAVISEPRDIPVGRVAVVADPFGNTLVLVDLSKGMYPAE